MTEIQTIHRYLSVQKWAEAEGLQLALESEGYVIKTEGFYDFYSNLEAVSAFLSGIAYGEVRQGK